jgi:hypothetical protein
MRKNKPSLTAPRFIPYRIPIISNRYNLLTSDNNSFRESNQKVANLSQCQKKQNVNKKATVTNKLNKVIILGDSHA